MWQVLFAPKNWTKIGAFVAWLAILTAYNRYALAHELTPLEMLRMFLGFMRQPVFGPLVFMLFYIFQPLIFFPSWLLTVSSGYLYGVVLGTLYTIIASNLSSAVAYMVGRYFYVEMPGSARTQGTLQYYVHQMQANSFATVLVMRFLFLPYDVVSYVGGFLRIRFWPFMLATFLGSIPGTVAFVLFGTSIKGDNFSGEKMTLNPWVLGMSASLFLVSLLLWLYFRKRL
ncbi:MAG: VTT domain-containing protein [Caldilineaceae bacterium]